MEFGIEKDYSATQKFHCLSIYLPVISNASISPCYFKCKNISHILKSFILDK